MSLFRRSALFYKQLTLRQLHRSAVAFTVPTFNMDKEKKAFENVLPEVIDTIVTGRKFSELPDVGIWVKELLNYTLTGGKLGRGLMTSIGYRMFEEPEYYSEEIQHSARVLGWCCEMIQSYLLVVDDILDGGTLRRGKPCWYQQPYVGISAINDAVLIYQCIMELLDIKFGKTPICIDLLRLFNESVCRAAMGEHLDCSLAYNKDKKNIDAITINNSSVTALNKTSYYSFRLPIFATLLLVKNGKQKATKELHDICLEFGRLLQFQDDYLDAYGDVTITGKNGTDIQEGKCSWVAATALQHCNEAQRSIFKEYYGSKDPEHVKRIKQLYDELQIPRLFEHNERTLYNELVRQIHALPTEGQRNFLLEILNACYKRIY